MKLQAIDFEAKIDNGTIILPTQYNFFSVSNARILILYEPEAVKPLSSQRENQLKQIIERLQEVNPFRNITDPVKWQKQQRDEWERRIIR